MFSKQKQPRVNGRFLTYAYEIDNDEIVKTYMIAENEGQMYRILNGKYYLCVLGDQTIYKLECRGYLFMEEVYQKYGVSEIPIIENDEKPKNLIKTLFQRGQN